MTDSPSLTGAAQGPPGATATAASGRRPLLLTGVCLLGWLAILIVALRIATRWDVYQSLPAWRLGATALALGLGAGALLGYWRMRRWGLWLLVVAILGRAVLGAINLAPLGAADLVFPVALLLAGSLYVRRLR